MRPSRTVAPIHFEDFDGHQYERLVFVYLLRTERWRSLEWYGQSGSDLGRDIWGILESGESLAVQCANRKMLTAAKISRDLNAVVRARNGAPDSFLVVSGSAVSAKVRDKVQEEAQKLRISRCNIWSAVEFEERLRRDAESVLRRFVDGEVFPDDPTALQIVANAESVDDATVVEHLISAFHRPAFTTPFHQESSLPAFRQAIGDTIQGLNTGIWLTRDGKEIGRLPSRHQLASQTLRDVLDQVVAELVQLRARFEELVRDGEIRPCGCGIRDCDVFFFSSIAAKEMDALRNIILGRIDKLRHAAGAAKSAALSVNVVASNNSGIIANKVTICGGPRPRSIVIPGSIATDPIKYNYVEYLIKTLTAFREIGDSYGQRRANFVHLGATRKILERQLGGLSKDLPLERFSEIVAHIREKIDNTSQGRRNRSRGEPNYHRFEDHGRLR
jgi:hypothetical protein